MSPQGDARVPCRTTNPRIFQKYETACVAYATHPTQRQRPSETPNPPMPNLT
ncbi:TPA: hypothetical protein ACFP4Y_000674 [Neisseria bacilliformis]|uniref:hypothetical protein n=1 Tax=Neisseria bacilliformis TaxID=267212 RepID=UPI001364B264|nr:hypothetical protein [Neisseria bacilliformis]